MDVPARLTLADLMISGSSIRSIVIGAVGIGVELGPTDASGTPRDRDFAIGRRAAAAALSDLGARVSELPVGPDRAPVWPDGIVGSIAHTRGVAVAVVARSTDLRSLGIDIESSSRSIDAGTVRRICRPEERERFTEPATILALFCAKEATYKALAPLGATKLGFHDVEYRVGEGGVLEGRIVNESVLSTVPRAFAARYVTVAGFVIAAVQIKAG